MDGGEVYELKHFKNYCDNCVASQSCEYYKEFTDIQERLDKLSREIKLLYLVATHNLVNFKAVVALTQPCPIQLEKEG
jgi:hypothetical protein